MQIKRLVITLKEILREKKITYADIATELEISASSVKRLFNNQQLSLGRLAKICAFAKIDFFDLARITEAREQSASQLTEQQEVHLCSKPILIIIGIYVGAGLSFEEILERLTIDESELTQLFIEFEKLGIIVLLPENRYRMCVSRNFSWIPNGPISHFFINSIAAKYIGKSINTPSNHTFLKWAFISPQAAEHMLSKITALVDEYMELESQENGVNSQLRDFTSLLVLYQKSWEHNEFHSLWHEHL